jgi:hypothetical protein
MTLIGNVGGWSARIAERNQRRLEDGRPRAEAVPVTLGEVRKQGLPYLIGGVVFHAGWCAVLIFRGS